MSSATAARSLRNSAMATSPVNARGGRLCFHGSCDGSGASVRAPAGGVLRS
jgi:hypothetical protein